MYLYKDAGGKVIYVGKAKSLRLRVRSYFTEDKPGRYQNRHADLRSRDVDYILVDNEKEALALENNLIKQYKPRFNILLRDDKTYPVHQAHQRKISARLRHPPAAQGRRHLLRSLLSRPTWRIGWCTSSIAIFWCHPARWISRAFIPSRACNTTFIAAWVRAWKGLTTDEAYAGAVRDVRLFLEGRHTDLARGLRAPHGSRVRRDALRRGRLAARSAHHRGRDRRAPEDGRRQGRRCGYLRRAMPSRRWWR